MEKKKKIFLYAPMILIIGVFFYWLQSYGHKSLNAFRELTPTKTQEKEDLAYSKILTSELFLVNQKSDCEILKKPYARLDELKKTEKLDLRFENTHKKIANKIYRLRHFYKDGDEGEIETFLVYLEDKAEMARIIEKSSYTKGTLYTKIEEAKGAILYHEEGVNLSENVSGTLFLHYIKNQLMGMQGVLQNQNDHKNIDCRFQQE
ncbi:MAG: hypothetical protein PHY93_14805 [Bacteriovorax sp.]|nr:hypothetical protein [Bacteriovorax sp.]